MEKVIFSRREFLNTPGFHTIANILISISKDDDESSFFGPFETTFCMSDCNRTITFDLDCKSVKGIENSIHKLSMIAEVCNDAIKAFENIRGEVEEYEKKKKDDNDKVQR